MDRTVEPMSKNAAQLWAEVQRLEQEMEELKKIVASSRSGDGCSPLTSGEKFELIAETRQNKENPLPVRELCELAGVSRSGYYNWVKSASRRAERERQDEADYALIQKARNSKAPPRGVRTIQRCMRQWEPPVVMNVKKIRRLIHKFEGLEEPQE